MIRSSLAACAAIALLSGCVSDGVSEFGQAAPRVGLVTGGRQLYLHAAGATSTRRQVRLMLAAIAQGDASVVHASIVAASPIEAETWTRTLMQLGVDPVRIAAAVEPRRPAVMVLTRTVAVPADCGAAIEPARVIAADPPPSLERLGHCIQDNNLAAMLEHPTDLVAPPTLAWGDGAHLAAGVSEWRGKSAGASSGAAGTQLPARGSSSSATMPTADK